jgi:nitrite reductase/ring-hydroxylating ferredoxin subunit
MAEWIKFAPWSELSPEGALECVFADRAIAILCRDATLYVIDGIGWHQGEVHGSLVRCPWHG